MFFGHRPHLAIDVYVRLPQTARDQMGGNVMRSPTLTAIRAGTVFSCGLLALAWLAPAATARVVTPRSGASVHALATVAFLDGIACESRSQCFAVGSNRHGQGVIVAVKSGSPGKITTVPKSARLYGIACPASGFCVAVGFSTSGDSVIVPVRNGRPAKAEVVKGSHGMNAVNCHTRASCWAVGQDKDAIHVVNGAIAKAYGSGFVPNVLNGVACSSATSCAVVGQAQVSFGPGYIGTLKNGKNHLTSVSHSLGVYGIACPSSSACVIVGFGATYNKGITAVIRNGHVGMAHQVAKTVLTAVACQSSKSCVAVGYSSRPGALVALGGAVVPVKSDVPGKVKKVAGVSLLAGVACPSASSCIAVGYRGQGSAERAVVYAFK